MPPVMVLAATASGGIWQQRFADLRLSCVPLKQICIKQEGQHF